ncbi:MAG: ABC transporter transmembrane domain-containing protein, partial [Gallionella sp.]
MLAKQFPPPYTSDFFIHAARALGFKIKRHDCDSRTVADFNLPCLVILHEPVPQGQPDVALEMAVAQVELAVMPTETSANLEENAGESSLATDKVPEQKAPIRKARPAIVFKIERDNVTLFEAGTNTPKLITHVEFAERFAGTAFQLALETQGIKDPDGAMNQQQAFGFNWFIPELLKHKRIGREVLITSLIIPLLGLVTPLFTQVIIDKVVVHRTLSTLIVIAIAIALAAFMVFSALLSWVRQYLILHTGNRVDAVLGHAVFEHLFNLPPRYFEQGPTGVIAARLHGVETIREFIASAAGVAVGLLIGCLERHIFSDEQIVASLIHYDVLAGKRMGGAGLRLLSAFRTWAENRGAFELNAGISSGTDLVKLDRFMRKLGFQQTGGNYSLMLGIQKEAKVTEGEHGQ